MRVGVVGGLVGPLETEIDYQIELALADAGYDAESFRSGWTARTSPPPSAPAPGDCVIIGGGNRKPEALLELVEDVGRRHIWRHFPCTGSAWKALSTRVSEALWMSVDGAWIEV